MTKVKQDKDQFDWLIKMKKQATKESVKLLGKTLG